MSLSRHQRFPRARISARAVRQFVGDTLAEWGLSERRGDIHLCASELAANAVRDSGRRDEATGKTVRAGFKLLRD